MERLDVLLDEQSKELLEVSWLLENYIEILENRPQSDQELIDLYNQLYDDNDDLIEVIIYYYENEVYETHPNFEAWVETNYPALYERVANYERVE